MPITMQLINGKEVTEHLDDLASLRLTIFREFPYLYDGDRAGEHRYLQLYAETTDAFVVACSAEGSMIGAATGIPLRYEVQELQSPFVATSYPVDEVYYVGELLFLPEYRNQGLGQELMTLVEEEIRRFGTYRYLCCATVARPDDHPLRPAAYTPIDRFLARTALQPLPGVTASFGWREIDGREERHIMNFWIKELSPGLGEGF